MMKPLVVIGTRPEAVKQAPVIRELRSRGHKVHALLTGQHSPESLEDTLRFFGILPLECENCGETQKAHLVGTLGSISWCIDVAIARLKPSHVVVQGDTTSALAGALAGFYAKVPVVHVEAGLRTNDLSQPWPEEMHRRAIATMASLHCCPTNSAARNLGGPTCIVVSKDKSAEIARALSKCPDGHAIEVTQMVDATQFASGNAIVTGNTAIDALHYTLDKLSGIQISAEQDILITMHRRENWKHVREVFECMTKLTERYRVTWIKHPNPAACVGITDGPVKIISPLNYPDMVQAMMRSRIILSDSGGIQEEAPTLQVPVLILRNKTERQEAVECGAAKLVGTDTEVISRECGRLLTNPAVYRSMIVDKNPLGDGHAAERIVDAMEAMPCK